MYTSNEVSFRCVAQHPFIHTNTQAHAQTHSSYLVFHLTVLLGWCLPLSTCIQSNSTQSYFSSNVNVDMPVKMDDVKTEYPGHPIL